MLTGKPITQSMKEQIIRDYIRTAKSRAVINRKYIQPLILRTYRKNPVDTKTITKALKDLPEPKDKVIAAIYDEYHKKLSESPIYERLKQKKGDGKALQKSIITIVNKIDEVMRKPIESMPLLINDPDVVVAYAARCRLKI